MKRVSKILIVVTTLVTCVGQGQTTPQRGITKFTATAEFTVLKGCGSGLNYDSTLGSCIYVFGLATTKYASGGHICVELPAGKTDKDMNIIPSASV